VKKVSKKSKNLIVRKQDGEDSEVLNQIQERLVSIENKIELLINKLSSQTPERHFEQPRHRDRDRHDGGFKERNLFKVICAECGNECQVPFKPSSGRPVYCKECFSKRKNSGNFVRENDNFSMHTEDRESFSPKRRFSFKRKRR